MIKTGADYLQDWKGPDIISGECPSCGCVIRIRAADTAKSNRINRATLLNPEAHSWNQADFYLLSGWAGSGSLCPFFNHILATRQQPLLCCVEFFCPSLRRAS